MPAAQAGDEAAGADQAQQSEIGPAVPRHVRLPSKGQAAQVRTVSTISACTVPPWSWSSARSEEHTSELQSLMRISYAVFCLKTKKQVDTPHEVRNDNVHTSIQK